MPCSSRPATPAAAAAALDRLRDPALAARLGAAAYAASGELTWDRRAEKIETFLTARLSAALSRAATRARQPLVVDDRDEEDQVHRPDHREEIPDRAAEQDRAGDQEGLGIGAEQFRQEEWSGA